MRPGVSGKSSAVLRARLDLSAPALRAASALLWEPSPGLAERYLDYLEAMHGVIRASVPLMVAAIRRCSELPADSVAGALAPYLVGHVAEETGHDDWLLDDVLVAGRDPEAVRSGLPGPVIARLVGPQYYWIAHHHPVALLGYIAVLEGNAPPPGLARHLAERTGLPDAAFRTLHAHAVLDTGHRDELDALLDRLPLEPPHLEAVCLSALHTVDAFAHLLHRVSTRGARSRPPKPEWTS